jgi:hypothetical protein
LKGFPPTLSGQLMAVVQNSNHTFSPAPSTPKAKTIHGKREGARPMACSTP